MASDDARDRATWLKGCLDNYPHLPLPPAQLFSNDNALKGYAAQQLTWRRHALKEGTGVTKFCKVLSEMIFLMAEEDPTDWYTAENLTKNIAPIKKATPTKKVLASKKALKVEKNPDPEDDFEPFTQKTPPRLTKAKAVKKKPNVLAKLKKPESA